ncbi:MAG: UDP-N-acetylmuramate--L-alanine ligase [Flammeovirgaceae bacterium]|nr:UDP-N-acetylmuramate--L-alanine ligase [Flammeovirgaceae bacterium]
MNLNQINSVYFIGIGGIGMSALAKWFQQRNLPVAGYDKVQTPLTLSLEQSGISIHYTDSVDQISDVFKDPLGTLLIYTPAIPKTHQELLYFQQGGFQIKKRSEVLGLITRDHFSIAVAGTHGKTTTSSMIAHILNQGPLGCSAFVGGIMTNYNSNLIIGGDQAPVVVEADEFDRSFLRLSPDFSIVTSLDPDHLDIYGDPEEMRRSYLDFIQLTDKEGTILLHEAVATQLRGVLDRKYKTYGLVDAQIMAKNIRVDGTKFIFDYVGDLEIKNIALALPGFHNVLNATAAITAGLDQGLSPQLIQTAIESYSGVKRRFEYIVNSEDLVYIDDYAHHPSEIEALIRSVKKLYPEKKITAIFQPHLFTRTRDFQKGFSESLSQADEVILLDIYPARELPIIGITSEVILDDISHESKCIAHLGDFPSFLNQYDLEVLLTIGAGDIDTLIPIIKSHYT